MGRRSLAGTPADRPTPAAGPLLATLRDAGRVRVQAAGWIGDRDAEQLQTASVHPRTTGCPLSAIRQHTSLRRHARQDVASTRRVPTSWDDAVQSMVLESGVWGALASHSRSHRFDPCHQPRRFPAAVARAAAEDRACAASRGDQGGAQRAGVRLSRSLAVGGAGDGARPAWCQLSGAVAGHEARRSRRSVGGQGRLGRAGRRGLAGGRRGGPVDRAHDLGSAAGQRVEGAVAQP